jgi:hypothetical protein
MAQLPAPIPPVAGSSIGKPGSKIFSHDFHSLRRLRITIFLRCKEIPCAFRIKKKGIFSGGRGMLKKMRQGEFPVGFPSAA